MSLSRYEGLRCQNVTFCPLCACGEPQLSLHLLFWPLGSLKEELLFAASLQTFVLPRGERRRVFFSPPFLKFCSRGLTRKQAPGGILNENKNQLGHGLVKIWGAVVWRSESRKVLGDDWSGTRKRTLTKFVLVISLKSKLWFTANISSIPRKVRRLWRVGLSFFVDFD